MTNSYKNVHTQQLGSGKVTSRPGILYCIIVNVATNADYIEIYDGRDATSGSKVCKIKALANRAVTFNISNGLLCERGIYVSCSETTVDWTIIWEPVEFAQITRPTPV